MPSLACRTTVAVMLLTASCSSALTADASVEVPSSTANATVVARSSTTATSTTTLARRLASSSTNPEPDRTGSAPPAWLGTRLLDLRPGEDNGVAQPTPTELIDRQLWTTDTIAPPLDDEFVSTIISPPPDDVVARSTWRQECPVGLEDLAYAQVLFVGFDGLLHTGELIAHVDHIDGLVDVFAELYALRFPIEQMMVTTQEMVDAHPTGDSNNTSSFVCRPAVNSGSWSRHALGGAIDINPFHNPYVLGDLVIPELAGAYTDREQARLGMVTPEIVELFADIGWGWGGDWSTTRDWMHFSDNGR